MTLAGGLALAVSAFTLTAAPVAGATTYNNDTPIIIPDRKRFIRTRRASP